MSGHYDAYNRQHTTINQSSLPAASRCAAAPTARGAITPCTMQTVRRTPPPPSSGTLTPCVNYYDRETRLYYLQSRYYDFANCRFINADTFATTNANGFLS